MVDEKQSSEETEVIESGNDVVDSGVAQYVFDQNNNERRSWKFCNDTSIPRSEVVFFTQMFFILILIALCTAKLTLFDLSCEESSIWISILSSTVGYLLPNPRI